MSGCWGLRIVVFGILGTDRFRVLTARRVLVVWGESKGKVGGQVIQRVARAAGSVELCGLRNITGAKSAEGMRVVQ